MRACNRCEKAGNKCRIGTESAKCLKCVEDGQPCDLYVPPHKLRRAHQERLRLRDKVREAKARLHRLEIELQSAEDKEEELVQTEWRNISELEQEEGKVQVLEGPLPPDPNALVFDTSLEQLVMPDGTPWLFPPFDETTGTAAVSSGSSPGS